MSSIICDVASKIRRNTQHPLKLTAMLYLKDAILRECYEECRDFIDIAQEFGADSEDIKRTLSDSLRLLRKTTYIETLV